MTDTTEASSSSPRADFSTQVARSIRALLSLHLWGIVLGTLTLFYVTREIHRDRLVIEPFSVPGFMADAGYSGQDFANRTADEIKRIEGITHSIAQTDHMVSDSELTIPDIEIPGTSLGTKAIVDIARSLFSIYPTKISATLTMAGLSPPTAKGGPAVLTFSVERNGERGAPIEISGDVSELSTLTSATALAVIKTINPYLYAAYAAHSHRYTGAIREIEAILLNPDTKTKKRIEAYNLWGSIYATKGQYLDATDRYQSALKLDGQFAPAYNNWGVALERQGKHEEAIAKYTAALSRDAKFAAAYENWGLTLVKQKKFTEAIDKYQHAIAVNRLDTRAYDCWGAALAAQAKYPEAIEQYKTALSINAGDVSALRGWGDLLISQTKIDQNKIDEALALYREASADDPEDPALYFAFGNVFRKLERYDEAEEQYDIAISKDSEYIGAYNNLGISLAAQGKLDLAVAMYEKALSFDANYAPALDNWGEALAKQGKSEEAIQHFLSAIKADPTLEDAYQNAAAAYKKAGKTEEAEQMDKRLEAVQKKSAAGGA